ncbi:glycosyltransferase family 4 protein [Methanoculleus sp. Wushi-C6]|uniref:Glycosyltransferase family 4 protein n=1 Tax=Methanoculleus caldifontis TaxID=2651577 RepID=A0ABU3X3G7_9EURY|nr:glycosyltransferase [Methanoculleus sp. Wushi-C6]MDV2482605.1 glycosyltransferase family 4 protein [Methanoculleus sp. Wushi-C6]
MIRIFAVLNGAVLRDDGNWSPTYTRIRFLLGELTRYEDLGVDTISFEVLPGQGLPERLCNNVIKTTVALRSAYRLLKDRPLAFFAYPHSLTTFQNRLLFRLCTACRIPTVVDIHDTREQAAAVGDGQFGVPQRTEGYCLGRATLLIALNPRMWERIRRTYHLDGTPVVFVPNGVEEEFFTQHSAPYSPVEGRFNICYTGALTKNRGIDLLVSSCGILRERYPWIRLHLIGPYGPGIPDDLKETIERSDFIVRAELPRSAIPAALAPMDLLVLPYNPGEPYLNLASPTKLFEYIGAARPILCTKCESLMDIDDEGGFTYADYSVPEMAEAIERLIFHPEVREEMGRALCRIRESHTWKERASRIYHGIRSLCGTI